MSQPSTVHPSDTLPDPLEQYARGLLFHGIAPADCSKMLRASTRRCAATPKGSSS